MTKRSSTLLGLAVVAFVVLAIGALFSSRPVPPKKPVVVKAPVVEVMIPTPETYQFSVESLGVVQPRTETTLVTEVTGLVEKVSEKFFAGGYFKKGEVLLTIDPTDYQVAVEQAKARLTSANAQLAQEQARAEQALKEWDLTGRSRENAPLLALRKPFLLEAEANVQSAKADLKNAERKLDRTVIRAPYDGMVKEKRADVGQFVSMGTALGVTFAVDFAEVRLPLTDEDLAFIDVPTWNENSVNPKVQLVATYAGKPNTWSAELVRMEGVVDETSRVHYAVARINDPYAVDPANRDNKPLKVGTFVTAQIQGIEVDGVIRIPRDVFRELDKVVVADANRELHIRSLDIIRSEAQYVYVRQGLEQGDQVVLTAMESPVQGMKLRIAGEPEPEAKIETELKPDEALAKNSESVPPVQ
ncbi:MAG: efflux RND transporter periplasmic adaptor subunit [Kangiellaceae bacterium]|jgi:RND family efflux transporter MFP subunit|nr:efflux RND transporter periplasmic adaptor subunit [Kangiellaceae bacterium]